jgi:L-ascorbate metabolism protein UlaG (beta-lactamase superfamily)
MNVRTKQRLRRGALALALLLALFALGAVADGWRAFGHGAEGERLERMKKSPRFVDGRFDNPEPLDNHFWDMVTGLAGVSPHATPLEPPRVATIDPERFRSAPHSGLRVTWFGHASLLIEIDGKRVLTDPVWSERASPFTWIGPSRWYAPPVALGDLPPLDAVVISHDHYDHLDEPTVVALAGRGATFIVPLGVGAHLEYWGVPNERIVELDWWERKDLGGLEIVCTPARHASGRTPFDQNSKLWASYALIGARHRAYFSGDTGLFPAMKEIGEKLGPFDVTLIEVGQYHRAWPDWHIGPEQAVTAHAWLRGKVMLPIHWGLFTLAYHGWTEPAERTLAEAEQRGVTLSLPLPGESIEPVGATTGARWWPSLPWTPAAEHPIVSTKVN